MASPLQEYENNNRERWKVMYDIPPWSIDSIVRIIKIIFFSVENDDAIQTIQRCMRIMLSDYCPVNYHNEYIFSESLKEDCNSGSGDRVLRLLDITIKYIRDYAPNKLQINSELGDLYGGDLLDVIEELLSNGSKWKVLRDQNSESGLIERINPEITKIAQEIDDDFLTKAWNQAFQSQPNPESAVELAQKSIEHIASTRGLTTATSKVYGTLLGDIRNNPQRYFSKAKDAYDLHNIIAKQPKDKININEKFADWFCNGMDLIQKTNPGRHSSKEVEEFSLSAEAAQQAVIIATMICWFIESGSFIKDDVSKKQSK